MAKKRGKKEGVEETPPRGDTAKTGGVASSFPFAYRRLAGTSREHRGRKGREKRRKLGAVMGFGAVVGEELEKKVERKDWRSWLLRGLRKKKGF